MRILFAAVPAYGHLLPLRPAVRAAQRAGHETAVMTHRSMADAVGPTRLIGVGAGVGDILTEAERRLPGVDLVSDLSAAPVVFVDVRMDQGAEDAVAAVRAFAPDLVIADHLDFPARFAADFVGVPCAVHGNSTPFDPLVVASFDEALAERYARVGLDRSRPVAYLDPWPRSLLRPGDVFPAERVAIRPEPHAGDGTTWTAPTFAGREDRPRVLLTLGTIVDDVELVVAIIRSLERIDVNVVVAPVPAGALDGRVDQTWVHHTGFVPMAALQEGVGVVVSSGGAGTVLSSLAAGLPMVLLPLGIDKPDNAARAAAVGAARVVEAADAVGPAVRDVLADPVVADAARVVASEIAATRTAGEVLELVLARATSVR